MEKTEYRILVNGACKTYTQADYPADQWTAIAEASESRGGINATLQKRFITDDAEFYNSLSDKAGFIRVKSLFVSLWGTMAEINS